MGKSDGNEPRRRGRDRVASRKATRFTALILIKCASIAATSTCLGHRLHIRWADAGCAPRYLIGFRPDDFKSCVRSSAWLGRRGTRSNPASHSSEPSSRKQPSRPGRLRSRSVTAARANNLQQQAASDAIGKAPERKFHMINRHLGPSFAHLPPVLPEFFSVRKQKIPPRLAIPDHFLLTRVAHSRFQLPLGLW